MIFANPGQWSNRVYEICYQHDDDGTDYKHEFADGVSLRANKDGSVTLYRPDGRPIWKDD